MTRAISEKKMRSKRKTSAKYKARSFTKNRLPVHPGDILLADFMRPLELSSYRLAQELKVSIPTVMRLCVDVGR